MEPTSHALNALSGIARVSSEIDAQDDPFAASELGSRGGGGKKWRRLLEAPNIDPELYELQ